MTRVREVGEFGLIERLQRILPSSPSVLVGIGDDCAVLRIFDRLMLVSCDMSIDGVHFRLDRAKPSEVGWKAAAASLSDIAAMGGTPMFSVVSLCTPPDMTVAAVEELYHGISGVMSQCGAVVVGGDTVRGDTLSLDVTVIGAVHGHRYLQRRGARPGDVLVVTGAPGRAGAGLHAQENGRDETALIAAHYHPTPRIAEGQWLSSSDAVHAAIDISDGVLADVGHLSAASELGVDIYRSQVTVPDDVSTYCAAQKLDPLSFVLAGGEDYELAFAVDSAHADALVESFAQMFRTQLHIWGRFTDDWTGVRVDGETPAFRGYDHFPAGEPGDQA